MADKIDAPKSLLHPLLTTKPARLPGCPASDIQRMVIGRALAGG